MRLFGKISHILKISRRLSYNASVYQSRPYHCPCQAKQWKDAADKRGSMPPTKLLQQIVLKPLMPRLIHVQLYSQKVGDVGNGTTLNMLRKRISFTGTPSGAEEGDLVVHTTLPIGVITPEPVEGKPNMKIIVVPLDLDNMDGQAFQNVLNSIQLLSRCGQQIEAFATQAIEDMRTQIRDEQLEQREQVEQPKQVDQLEQQEKSSLQQLEQLEEQKKSGLEQLEQLEQSEKSSAQQLEQLEQQEKSGLKQLEQLEQSEKSSLQQLEQVPVHDELSQWDTYNIAELADAVAQPLGAPHECVEQQKSITGSSKPAENVEWSPVQPGPCTPQLPTATPSEQGPSNVPLTQPSTLPQAEPQGAPQIQAESAKELHEMHEIKFDVPESLDTRLKEMQISSMDLTFDLDMTNVGEAIKSASLQQVNCGETSVGTMPLTFNAVITGNMEIDAAKLDLASWNEQEVPIFTEKVSKVAARVCSTALQKGFPAAVTVSQENESCTPGKQDADSADKSEYIKCVATKDKGCVSPGNENLPKYDAAEQTEKQGDETCHATSWGSTGYTSHWHAARALKRNMEVKHMKINHHRPQIYNETAMNQPMEQETGTVEPSIYEDDFNGPYSKDGCKHPPIKEKKKCPGKCPLLDDPCKENPCNRPNKPKPRPKKRSFSTSVVRASKDSGCGKDKKKDPCAKFKKDNKKDSGCGKDKKKDPCAKKKDSGCGKDKKKDPCAKFKKDKNKDSCGGKDKKKDPCAKKKDSGCGKDKKKDPCAKKKDSGCGKDNKKDPCAKFNNDKSKDPCSNKKKKSGCDKKEKKDPCAKKDPCKKKYSTYTTRRPSFRPRRSLTPKSGNYFDDLKKRFISTMYRRLDTEKKSAIELSCMQAMGPRFMVCSLPWRRHYAGKKKKERSGKCDPLDQKYPTNRKKQKKPLNRLRTDCFDRSDCPLKLCKGECDKVKFPKKSCDRSKNKKSDKDKVEGNKWLHAGTRLFKQPRVMVAARPYTTACPNESERSSEIEVVHIPMSYKITKCTEPWACPKEFDVVIRTASVAITGSDIHVFENGHRDVEGMTLGHDATGFVAEVGRCVHHLRVGDRVVMESGLSCGICDLCKQGLYNMCASLVYNGFLRTHQVHPADLCHRLPDCITMEEGALTQTLALGCQACFKANITPTSNVLIIGSCPTAVSAAMCASAIGAKQVAIASTMGTTLDMVSRDFGFNHVHFDSNALFGEVLEAIFCKFQEWPSCVINCAISAMTMNLAIMALQPCGVIVLAECESECASFNALDILMKNIRLIPSFRSTNMFPTALQLMKSGRAPMHKFIANTYGWHELEDAFRCAQHESNVGIRKIIVSSAEDNALAELYAKKRNG